MKKGFNEQKTGTEKRDQIEPVLETLDVLAEGAERKGNFSNLLSKPSAIDVLSSEQEYLGLLHSAYHLQQMLFCYSLQGFTLEQFYHIHVAFTECHIDWGVTFYILLLIRICPFVQED